MSAGKKNDNKNNPIESISLEISEGVNVFVTKIIEILSGIIQIGIDSVSRKGGESGKRKSSIALKKGFKKWEK
jgi:hypothetical protein